MYPGNGYAEHVFAPPFCDGNPHIARPTLRRVTGQTNVPPDL